MPEEIKIFDADQAALMLRMTKRRLIKVAKINGLCMIYGRKVMFTSAHLADILGVMKCPPNSTGKLIEKHSIASGQSPDSAFSRVLAEVTAKRRKR